MDESGDHSLTSIDKDYPIFVLAFCIFHKRHYAEKVIPAIEKLKFNYFGHDSVVLHENEICKQKGDFAFLTHLPTRNAFMASLTSIMEASNFIFISCVVDKARLSRGAGGPPNPYHIALGICLEALHGFLVEKVQEHVKTHVVVECRGRKEDEVARPVGLSYLRPQQPNQAFDILKKKLFCDGGRACVGQGYENVGLMIHPPRKAKSPDEPTEA
ncbi:DUF3800 domain-containing protein [Alcaligenaceae bacterium CGII-47]|nr:DUF3800 domain-containing protein [Alcaligenaceae bacterium CGII-47]